MEKTIALLTDQLMGIHSGGISDGLVETVKVPYYGQETPLKYISSVVEQDRRVSIIPYDRGMMESILQTLKKCGFTAHKFSKQEVVITIPRNTGEECEKIFVRMRKLGEDAKVSIRNIRKNHKRRRGSLTPDEKRSDDKKVQKMTDTAIRNIDDIISQRIEHVR